MEDNILLNNIQLIDYNQFALDYENALKILKVYLENISENLKNNTGRTPIEYLKTRVKSLESIKSKLTRKQLPITLEQAKTSLNDIAGLRIVCSFLSDIKLIYDILSQQNNFKILEVVDYINNPKLSGYRSLHLTMEIPILKIDKNNFYEKFVKVEIQIRTIAMDFWASLEHQLIYKKNVEVDVIKDMRESAVIISQVDKKMQEIADKGVLINDIHK